MSHPETVLVEQVDREAALSRISDSVARGLVRAGEWDSHPRVQDIARARQALGESA